MAYFPLSIDLTDRNCLVVGGGAVAESKIRTLLSFGARIRAVAPEFTAGILQLAGEGSGAAQRIPLSGGKGETAQRIPLSGGESGAAQRLSLALREFREEDLEGAVLAVAATDRRNVNERLFHLCTERRIPVNVVDRKELCTFYFPSMVRREDLVVSVSTGGSSPALAARLRRKLEAAVPEAYGEIGRELGRWRGYVQERVPDQRERKEIFERLLDLLERESGAAEKEERGGPEMETDSRLLLRRSEVDDVIRAVRARE
ncbi:MAG: bifunctional precorrin-2 dehydrogenase/sirohydrochlorin ferrochelatase [Eubacteriales bacterium]|nr:bifunctional precorrin-2 dehydrogenase/sirohydrochlorin ferrochelatase [Eubacteriales bacterium]